MTGNARHDGELVVGQSGVPARHDGGGGGATAASTVRPARHPDFLPVVPASPPFLPPARPFCLAFGPPFAPPEDRPSRRRGAFSCEITENARVFAPFFRVLAPEFRPKIPRFSVISHPFSVISHPRPSLQSRLPHHARRTPARAIGTTAKKVVVAGYGAEAMRRDAKRRRQRSITKCGITGNRKARRRGRRRDSGFQRPAHPAPVALPVVSPLPRLFSVRIAPSVWPLPPVSPLAPPGGRLPPAGGGIFRARLRKKLAFLRRFSIFSHLNFAPKSPRFP